MTKIAVLLAVLVVVSAFVMVPVVSAEEAEEVDTEGTVEQTPVHEFPSEVVVVEESWNGNEYTATLENRGDSTQDLLVSDAGIDFESDDPLERQLVRINPGETEDIRFVTYDEPRLTIDDGNYGATESLYRTWGDTSSDSLVGSPLENPIPTVIATGVSGLAALFVYHNRKIRPRSGPKIAIR